MAVVILALVVRPPVRPLAGCRARVRTP